MTTQLQLVIIKKLIIYSRDSCTLFPVQPGYLYYYKMLGQFTRQVTCITTIHSSHFSNSAGARRYLQKFLVPCAMKHLARNGIYHNTHRQTLLYGNKKATVETESKYLRKEFRFCKTVNTTPLHEDRLRHDVQTQMKDRNTTTKWAKCKGGGVHCYHWENNFEERLAKRLQ